MNGQVIIGYDPREDLACRVAALSLARRSSVAVPISYLRLWQLQSACLYMRPLERRGRDLWDTISDAPMSTEHAIARFLLPWIAPTSGPRWALFVDGDVLFLEDVARLFEQADGRYAVQCVRHPPLGSAGLKKGGQTQTVYPRKNWSSVMLWNLDHPAHRRPELWNAINTRPGRDLHAFCWLDDAEIGQLDPAWNHLVGVNEPRKDAKIVHFTLGMPYVNGYEDSEYALHWRGERALISRGSEVSA